LQVARHQYSLDIRDAGDGERQKFDKATVQWLDDKLRIGDIIYDVHAGVGLYALLAAKHRGAIVVAFEPGFAAFQQLCDNVLLNGCDGSVTALPLAIADFNGLGQLKYPPGFAGSERHSVRRSPGIASGRRAAGDERAFQQSVCTASLDGARATYALPSPTHIRIGPRAAPLSVLGGAAQVLSSPTLRSIFMTVAQEGREAVLARAASLGWLAARTHEISRERCHLLLCREAAAALPADAIQ
jgi:FkbM family methyltransferase